MIKKGEVRKEGKGIVKGGMGERKDLKVRQDLVEDASLRQGMSAIRKIGNDGTE